MFPITIVDYGMGNLGSVQKAFQAIGIDSAFTQNPNEIEKANGLVLPGVGAFDAARHNLDKFGLTEAIQQYIQAKRPFLGICLGLQLLFEKSEEGRLPGLGIYKGIVKRFQSNDPHIKIPHMGWNNIQVKKRETLFLQEIPSSSFVYFVHSYYVDPLDKSIVSSETDFCGTFTSSISEGNLLATQFHPEKSGKIGLKILENFILKIKTT